MNAGDNSEVLKRHRAKKAVIKMGKTVDNIIDTFWKLPNFANLVMVSVKFFVQRCSMRKMKNMPARSLRLFEIKPKALTRQQVHMRKWHQESKDKPNPWHQTRQTRRCAIIRSILPAVHEGVR